LGEAAGRRRLRRRMARRDVRVPPGALVKMVEAADVSCEGRAEDADVSCEGRARFISANME